MSDVNLFSLGEYCLVRIVNELGVFLNVKSGAGHTRLSIHWEDYCLQCVPGDWKCAFDENKSADDHTQSQAPPVWGALWTLTGSDALISCQHEGRIPNSTDTPLTRLWSHLLRSSKDKSHFHNYSPGYLSFRSIFASSCSGIPITLKFFSCSCRRITLATF